MMTLTLRSALALPLAFGLLACDEGIDADPQFRTAATLTTEDTTVQLDIELQPVRVTSYQLNADLGGVLEERGMDLILDGAGEPIEDAMLALRLEGVALPPAGFGDHVITLRRGNEAAELPYEVFHFQVSIAANGGAVTDLVLGQPAEPDSADFLVWNHGFDPQVPAALEPVVSVEYELVAVDGTTTTCVVDGPIQQSLAFKYRELDEAKGRMQIEIADACAEVVENAAAAKPSEAFFVRCDRSTMSTVVGMRKFGDITLKRGVMDAVGELVVELSAE